MSDIRGEIVKAEKTMKKYSTDHGLLQLDGRSGGRRKSKKIIQHGGSQKDAEVILFHAKKCGHCVNFMPEWKKFVNTNKHNVHIREHEVDDDDARELMEKYGVSGFPTVVVVKKGVKHQHYDGERKAEALEEHLEELLNEDVDEDDDDDDDDDDVDDDDADDDGEEDDKNVHIILFHANWCGHCKNFMPEWEKFKREKNHGCKVSEHEEADSLSKSLGQQFGVQGYPTIVVKRGDSHEHYKGDRTSDALKNFVATVLEN